MTTVFSRKQAPVDSAAAAYDVALGLLGRREHSVLELRQKLNLRGFSHSSIEPSLDRLQADGYLSDQRFAELYAHSRADKGYGPLRIRSELSSRGVDTEAIDAVLAAMADLWWIKLEQLYRKRFADKPVNSAEQVKQQRFLRHRGFSLDQINRLLRQVKTPK